MPSVACPSCGKKLNVPEAAVGKDGRCPACKHGFRVPPAEPPAEAGYTLAAAEPPAPPPPAVKRKRKKKKRAAEPAAPPLGLLLAGVALLVGLVVGGLVWQFGGSDEGGGRVAPVTDDGEENPTREARGSDTSFALSMASPADPAEWAVAVDPAPPAAKFNAAFSLPYHDPAAGPLPTNLLGFATTQAVAFAPAANRAAVFLSSPVPRPASERPPDRAPTRLELFLYDLTGAADPVARVTLDTGYPQPGGEGMFRSTEAMAVCRQPADLSPGGGWAAVRLPADPKRVAVWRATGDPLRVEADAQVDWVGMPADASLVVLAGGRLTRWAEAGGEMAAGPRTDPALKLGPPVVTTPGRTFIGAVADRTIHWFRADTLKPAGRLPLARLPEVAKKPDSNSGRKEPPVALAVRPDGKRLAVAEGDLAGRVVEYDVATGVPVGGVRVPAGVPLPPDVAWWSGPRHLVAGGRHVIDLDTGLTIGRYDWETPGANVAPASPDGRLWHTAYYLPPEREPGEGAAGLLRTILPGGDPLAAVLGKVPNLTDRDGLRANRLLLSAAPADRLAPLVGGEGTVWQPGTRVRVVGAAEDADPVWGRRAAARVADVLAESGFPVDPSAPFTARATLRRPEHGTVQQFVTVQEGAVFDRGFVNDTPVSWVRLDGEVVNRAGQVVCRFGSISNSHPGGVTAFNANTRTPDEMRAACLASFNPERLTRRAALGPDGAPLKLPLTLPLGIDGLFTRKSETPDG